MNWRYETWRKLYVREEGSFAALSYSARAAAAMLLKVCDSRGRIYARPGEEVTEAICFRLGASRGERRTLRAALAELVADGYLVSEAVGCLRIRNFRSAGNGGTDQEPTVHVEAPPPRSEVEANTHRSSAEAAPIAQPIDSEPAPNEQRTGVEAVSNEIPTSIEERGKSADSFTSDPDVPSVPFLPAVPTVPAQASERTARARDLPASTTARPSMQPDGDAPIDPDHPINTAYDLVWGYRVRWQKRHNAEWAGEKGCEVLAREIMERLAEQGPVPFARAAARLPKCLDLYLRDANVAGHRHPFKWFADRLAALMADVETGTSTSVRAAKPTAVFCDGHKNGALNLRPSPTPTDSCPECRHVVARKSPRPASEPTRADPRGAWPAPAPKAAAKGGA